MPSYLPSALDSFYLFSLLPSFSNPFLSLAILSHPISVCCCCSDEFLVIARKSGVITRYSLPHLNIENTYIVHTEPYRYCTYSLSFILIVALYLSIILFYITFSCFSLIFSFIFPLFSSPFPVRISLNSTSTRLALIDAPGVLHLLDLDARIPDDEEWLVSAPSKAPLHFLIYVFSVLIFLFYIFFLSKLLYH